MKLAHYDDGKHKWMSHEVFLKEDDNFYCKEFDLFSHNITDARGYGETKGEALQDLKNKLEIEGYTLIPLRFYFVKGRCKVEIGVCKGKKNYDKRDSMLEKAHKRDMERALKERNR